MSQYWTEAEEAIIRPFCDMSGSEGMLGHLGASELRSEGFKRSESSVTHMIRKMRQQAKQKEATQ